jgi:hypothetical protein
MVLQFSMPRKPRSRRPEILIRNIEITSGQAGVSISASRQKAEDPELSGSARVELAGVMDEPIRGVREVEMTVYPTDDPRPGKDPIPWVGLVHGVKPVLRPAFFISHRDFERVLMLALSGQLKHAYMAVTQPHYNTAYVTNVSFSTNPEE